VVLGIPYDLQKVEHMANTPYETSAMYQPKVGRMHPDPEVVAEAVERLAAAKRPIILGGRGVLRAGARDAVIRLADRCGALLSNTLPVRGIFDDIRSPWHHRQLSRRWAGRYESADVACGRFEPVLLRRWRALLGKGFQDPIGRCPPRLARWAEGRRPLHQIGCAGRR
jgi:glyoxylate carboligase